MVSEGASDEAVMEDIGRLRNRYPDDGDVTLVCAAYDEFVARICFLWKLKRDVLVALGKGFR